MTKQQHAAKCSSSNKKYQPVPVDAAKTIAEKYNKSIVITPQETWKERWNKFAQINDFYLRGVPMGKLEAFISTELTAAREEGRKEEREHHIGIYRFLLGYTDFPPKPENAPQFWWRSELRKRLPDDIINFLSTTQKGDNKNV